MSLPYVPRFDLIQRTLPAKHDRASLFTVTIGPLQFEIEAHQRVDIQRADEDVEERMAYEQLALRQIARENPSAVLASFLDRHCPDQGGIRHAPPTSPLKTVNDLAATGWDDDIALDQSNSAISRASSSVPQALQKSKVRLSTLLQCAVCQHFTPVIPDEYRNLEFPELPKILDRLTDAMVKRATNVGTLLASIEAHIKADKAENTELTRMGNELKELEATGQANATHATALERALAKHLTSHRRHDRQLLEVGKWRCMTSRLGCSHSLASYLCR